MHINIFTQLAFVLTLSSGLGYLIWKLKLPLLLAYLLVGFILSNVTLLDINHSPVVILPDIGVAFVLFLIGMELDLREIRVIGRQIIITGLIQMIISAICGYLISTFFGFHGIEAFYLGAGLSFSSTIVVIKMLLEKKDLNSLYAKLSLGVLLLEDLVAIILLMFMSVGPSALNFGAQATFPILILIVKASLMVLSAYLIAKYVLPKIFDAVAKSPELLFLSAITWCFLFSSLALFLGFSLVIGAFIAGVALASSPFHIHISGKIKPIRDFFLILFFVYLGAQAQVNTVLQNLPIIIIFTLFAIVAKPIIYLLLFGAFGFRRHTIFQASINLSQISEFSLIMLLVGTQFGVVSQSALSIMAFTIILSIIISSILISKSKLIYPLFKPLLSFFEVKDKFHELEQRVDHDMADHVVIIGGDSVGGPIITYLKKEKIPFIVLDFNPEIVKKLIKQDAKVVYGDIGDPDIADSLKLDRAKLIISTTSNLDDNKVLLDILKSKKAQAKVVARAGEHEDAKELKKYGADYVIFPEDVSADFLVQQLKTHWPNVNFPALL